MSDITDWSAIAISVAAIALSVSEARATRRHNRLSVAPRLTGRADISPGAQTANLQIRNSGLGPAVIQSFRWTVDGKSRTQLGIQRFEQLTALLGLELGVNYDFPLPNTVLEATATFNVISVPIGGWNLVRSRQIRSAFRRLKFDVEYESIYQQRQSFTLDGTQFYPPEEQGQERIELDPELGG